MVQRLVSPRVSRRRVIQGLGGAAGALGGWLGVGALGCGGAAQRGAAEAGTVGMGAGPVASWPLPLQALHDAMARHVHGGAVPGLVTLVSVRGEVYAAPIGALALGGLPLGRDAIFRVASMSKPVTAVAALLLVEEGKLGLDESVEGLLPELANRRVLRRLDGPLEDTLPAVRAITLRDLLTFRMGFGIVLEDPARYPILQALNELLPNHGMPGAAHTPAPDEWMRRLGSLPLMHQPGEKWMYHTSADVLGVLVARAAGEPLDSVFRRRIFGPLGMRDTGFSVPRPQLSRLTTSYLANPQTGALELYDEPGGAWSHPPAFASGGAGLVSTADDFAAFGHMLLNRGTYGTTRLLSPESVALMTTDQLTPEQKAGSGLTPDFFESHGWGFGVSVLTRDDPAQGSAGTFGWYGGLGTSWYTHPSQDFMTILLTNRSWTGPVPPDMFREFWSLAQRAVEG